MALDAYAEDQITQYETQLLGKVPENTSIGNGKLMGQLKWGEGPLYWDIRNRLIERGVLVQGRGQGGSVRRRLSDAPVASMSDKTSLAVDVAASIDELTRESDLYAPMADVIRNRWAKERRLDSLLVEVTAAQGSRQTKGKWTRPDITAASYTTFTHLPGRHFDVITFEIKPYTLLDVTVVYEALGHRRASTRAYALLHIPAEHAESLQAVLDDIEIEAKRHGVGVIVAAKADDYETWEEVVEAARHEPDPERMNEFLAVQMSQGFRDQIIKWFK